VSSSAWCRPGSTISWGRSEFEDLIGKGRARMMRGSSLDDIDELAERLFEQKIVSRIYPEMARAGSRPHGARPHRRAELVGR